MIFKKKNVVMLAALFSTMNAQAYDVLLTETARVLQKRFGGTVLELQQKNNASAPAPTETLTGLSPECDYLITASGD